MKSKGKHEPQTIPISKRPVSVVRAPQTASSHPIKRLDPRFDRSCGEFKDDMFKKAYTWVSELQASEEKLLEHQLRKAKNPKLQNDLKRVLDRRRTQRDVETRRETRRLAKREILEQEKALLEQGIKKAPFFYKKNELKGKLDGSSKDITDKGSFMLQRKREKRTASRMKRKGQQAPHLGL